MGLKALWIGVGENAEILLSAVEDNFVGRDE
jgi:hypothetical protein